MRINKISEHIQKFVKKVAENDKLYDKINNKILPIGESTLATGMYALFIEKNDHIEKERKPALQYQNLICGAVGMFSANKINQSIQKHQAKIIEALKKNKDIQNPETLINGLKIAMPIIIFSAIIRFLLPVISTPISSKINQKRIKNTIDINA